MHVHIPAALEVCGPGGWRDIRPHVLACTSAHILSAQSSSRGAQLLQELLQLSGQVPDYAKAWLTWTPQWQAFPTNFLKLWGGRYGPALKGGDWWLWFTSIYIHRDLQHIVSNMLLFVAMSVHLELNYGWWRLVLVWLISGAARSFLLARQQGRAKSWLHKLLFVHFLPLPFVTQQRVVHTREQQKLACDIYCKHCITALMSYGTSSSIQASTNAPLHGIASTCPHKHVQCVPRQNRLLEVYGCAGVGGNLVSGLFEDYCTTLVGASGAVFGFMGFFVADLIVNFESIAWPFVRAFTILVFLIFFVINAVVERSSKSNVSHASHIGGLICGLFPSMLFLPNLRDRRLAAARRQEQERRRSSALGHTASVSRCADCLSHAMIGVARTGTACHNWSRHLCAFTR